MTSYQDGPEVRHLAGQGADPPFHPPPTSSRVLGWSLVIHLLVVAVLVLAAVVAVRGDDRLW